MITKSNKTLVLSIVVIFVLALSLSVGAQNFPEKEVEIIVPFSVGGGTDTYVRQLARPLEEELGVPVIVRNVEGAASLRGISEVYRSDPDGYTLIAFNPPSPQMAIMEQGSDFTVDEFEIIGRYALDGPLLSVHPDQPYDTFDELREAYNTGEITIKGTQSEGTILHVSSILLKEFADFNYDSLVPYPGSGEIIAALLRKEVPAIISTTGAAINNVMDGEVKPIAFLGLERYPGLPDVPSIAELGYENAAVPQFRVLAAPPNTPQEVLDTLETAMMNAVNNEEFRSWAEEADRPIVPGTAEEATKANEALEGLMQFLVEEEIL